MQETTDLIEMTGGGRIALHHVSGTATKSVPLIVTHGTLSNVETIRPLAYHLSEQGFDCWMLDWGGHGESRAASPNQNFEYPAFHDLPTAIQTVRQKTGRDKLYFVSHSGGGHLLLMYLARDPARAAGIAGFVTMGTQATDAAPSRFEKGRLRLLQAVTNMLRRTPESLLPLTGESEPTRLLVQWATWNIRERWVGDDQFDYLAALSALSIPALILAGGNDQIAPPSGCRKIFDALGSTDKTWHLFSKQQGNSKDFSHAQLVRGRAARAEVFPLITNWLNQRQ